jgi:hypothetical protein
MSGLPHWESDMLNLLAHPVTGLVMAVGLIAAAYLICI